MEQGEGWKRSSEPEISQWFSYFTHFLLKEATSIQAAAENQDLKTAT